MQAAEKKRPKDEKEFVHRLKPFAKLQTAADFELFAADLLCASNSDLELRYIILMLFA